MAVTTLGYALLSLLAVKSYTGYDLGRLMRSPISVFWEARYSQIYPELSRLESQGLVTYQAVTQHDFPDKKIYTITDDGRALLRIWATEPVDPPVIRDELVIKAYSLWMVDPEPAQELFRYHEQYHLAKLQQYEEVQRDLEASPEALNDPTSPTFAQYIILQRDLGFEREYAVWCHWVVERLEQTMRFSSPPIN
ncbi:negative transcription regulator PadR [Dictyobacter alpinus]|uniref:Negative transcription regulator PadR n=1 Tax=Dictyobacter alpinus TaxID=2014873 RepID=A0A402BGU6_9CHLR|nr:PadR family transcriptional regulator [Dictyobacter alpinus]GCE30566.1 negative transcription regulator PadR [Dictyobacter alpinus]